MDHQATPNAPLTPVHPTMDHQAAWDALVTPVHRVMGYKATRDAPFTPVRRAMDIRARRPILPTPVRATVTKILSLAIPVIATRRTGRLGPCTRSSLLAEFWARQRSSRHRCAWRSRVR